MSTWARSAGAPVGMQDHLPGREEVFGAVDRVLARAEFHVAEPSVLTRLWQSAQEAMREAQLWVLSRIAELIGGNLSLTGMLLVLLLLALLGLLLYLLWSLFGPSPSRPREDTEEDPSPPGSDVLPRAADRLREAYELARSGRHGEAMHRLYQGVLLWLDEGGHARYEEDKTGGEYARELERVELARSFRRLLRAFYPVAYGGRPAHEAAWEEMAAAAGQLGVQR